MNVTVRRALLSVWDKTGLLELAKCLAKHGTELYSTGKTASLLREGGLTVHDVTELTNRPEAFGGRMKTLSYEISSALLFDRDRDKDEAQKLGIVPIDMVVANLYPFAEYRDKGLALAELVEYVDIGGPTMVRASAKNFKHVASVVAPADYADLVKELDANAGALSLETRKRLMRSAFRATADYDMQIAEHLDEESGEPSRTLGFSTGAVLRYGENPHQSARVLTRRGGGSKSPTELLLSGKELSYNNLLDVESALAAVRGHGPNACAVVKHGNPCGVAVGTTRARALELAWAGDPVSAFGSVIAFGGKVSRADVEPLALDHADKSKRRFVEVVVAPAFDDDAVAYLATNKNLRVLPLSAESVFSKEELRLCLGHLLVQEADDTLFTKLETATKTAHTPDRELAEFGSRVVRSVKSNAITIVKRKKDGELQLLGMGAGQPNRVASARIAVERAHATLRAELGEETDARIAAACADAYVVSDAFLPFADTLEVVADGGFRVLLQPGGSIRDAEVVAAGDARGVAVVMTETRHFRH
jgi:phosphoribosylaminoimidazolecarboxamide formyltransferase / IMP cyclohydrolase